MAHGHRDLPEAQLQGRGQPATPMKLGRGTPSSPWWGCCLPPCPSSPSPCSHLRLAGIPSLTCWCGYGWGWLGVEKCPSKVVSGPPHSAGTHTHVALHPVPFPSPHLPAPPPLPPAARHRALWPGATGAAGGGTGPPLCFRLQLASSLLSVQSWKPSQTKPRWRQSPWSQKCSSQAQLSAAQAEMARLAVVSHQAPSPAPVPWALWETTLALPTACLQRGVLAVPGGRGTHSHWEPRRGSGR